MIDSDLKKEEVMTQKFDHAWKYFELHANQRIILIRFYIVFLSLFATGIVFLIIRFPEKTVLHEWSALLLSFAFMIITGVFWLLDERNRKLIHLAEDALRDLENDSFSKEISNINIFNREKNTCNNACSFGSHTSCFRFLFVLAFIMAAIFIVFSAYSMSYYECHPEKVNQCLYSSNGLDSQTQSTNIDRNINTEE